MRQRISSVERHCERLLANHNSDPTGEQGENQLPIWFNDAQHHFQWKENNNQNRGQQAHRANMQEVQQQLGVVQAPLGPGNPPREVAAQNPPQQGGPQQLAASMQVAEALLNGDSSDDDEVGAIAVNNDIQADSQGNGTGTSQNTNAMANNGGQAMVSQEQRPVRRRTQSPLATGGGTRSNRCQSDGCTTHDEIIDGQENLGNLVGALGTMASAIAPAAAAPAPPPTMADHIGNPRSIQET